MADKKKKSSIWYTITNVNELNKEEYLKLIKRVSLFVGLGFVASFIVFFVIALLGGIGNVIKTMHITILLLRTLTTFLRMEPVLRTQWRPQSQLNLEKNPMSYSMA